ncbi:MAG: regulatory iron-sulfur-containing complex subunit RicT [Solidesulfovibrio sp.]
MSHILGIKFRDHGQVYYFDSGPFVVATGDYVLVQTDQGLGMGRVALVRQSVPEGMEPQELKPIFRLPSPEDMEIQRENDALAREAHTYCRKCIESRALEMKLVDVEVLHDRCKIVFYFTAPGRIDFRELVKDLVKSYHTRIELRQIGVRHETQMLGAIGNCGQMCCCRRFMRKFAPVTIKMAKEQNLFLNPTKISGICGRLLCCLSFEQENYEQFQRKCPKVGKKFATSQGAAKVLRTNLFRETVTILDEAGDEHEMTVEEWGAIVEPRQPSAEAASPPRGESRPPEAGRSDAGRSESARADSGRPESGRSEQRRAEGAPQGARSEGREGHRATPAGAPAGQGPDGASPPEREGARHSRRGRRPARKNTRPNREQTPEQPQRPRQNRPDTRPDTRPSGGKPSRDPETGS